MAAAGPLPTVRLRSGTMGRAAFPRGDHVMWPGDDGGLEVLGVWPDLDGPPCLQSTSNS